MKMIWYSRKSLERKKEKRKGMKKWKKEKNENISFLQYSYNNKNKKNPSTVCVREMFYDIEKNQENCLKKTKEAEITLSGRAI